MTDYTNSHFKNRAMNRRGFLRDAAVASAAFWAPFPGSLFRQDPLGNSSHDRLGLMLGVRYPTKEPMANRVAMENAKKIGYEMVEIVGFNGNEPDELQRMASGLRLSIHSVHIGWDQQRAFTAKGEIGDPALGGPANVTDIVYTPEGVVQFAKVSLPLVRDLGAQWAVVGGTRIANFASLENLKRYCDALNTANDLAQKLGIGLGYHNHSLDFTPVGGRVPYDFIAEQTHPSLKFQMDIGWVMICGQDPIALSKKYSHRVFSYHLKDVRKDKKTEAQWGDGTGTLDWAAFYAASRSVDNPLYYVEGGGDPAKGFQFLKAHGWRTAS